MLEYLQIILIILLLPVAILIKTYKNPKGVLILLMMYVYHMSFAYIFFYHIPSDSSGFYYSVAEGLNTMSLAEISPGNQFIKYTVYICIEYLHLSYLGITLLFTSLSYIGFWMLFKIVETHKIKYLWLILLIPSLHLWTVGLGKDSLAFLFISTLLYGVLKINYIIYF